MDGKTMVPIKLAMVSKNNKIKVFFSKNCSKFIPDKSQFLTYMAYGTYILFGVNSVVMSGAVKLSQM